MTPAAHKMAKDLLSLIGALEAVKTGAAEAMCLTRLEQSVFDKARALREEMNRPVEVRPWTPHEPFKPGTAL